jgi:hypothetical protein
MAKEFSTIFVKITTKNKIIFDGHVIAAENCVMFGDHL